ncbi:MAG TPA: RNA polymerase sigma factor [Bacteroidales bacterium]|nr:RNA polymerase sigma factor [Bacteroidales bacterium]
MTEQGGYQIHLELINRCRNGDRLAQTELYSLYYKAMYNTCYRMLNNQVEAEDVMQESFLSAFLKINSYRGEMSFGSWLKKIVVNKAIDVLRSRKVKFEEINEKFAAEDESEAFRNMVSEESSGLVRKIREAVKLLPEGFRVVLSLSLFEGYDHEEIAMILGISESTSRSQLARAKKKLVEYLKNEGNETVG